MRWASLSPETTQWVQALGRSASLVGRSHLCVGSRSLEKLPICTRPGGEPTGWERYVGPYPPDFGVLSTLRPQGVLTLFPPLPPDLSEKELIALFQGAMGFPIQVFSASAHSW
ncbi:MAG: hypothetical protein N2170_07960, partial [Bacteroidia bacterium]|nr:hypothetical protein [Bacteroidia bacterium]